MSRRVGAPSRDAVFAARCRAAHPGIRSALAVVLGSNYECEADRFREMCGGEPGRAPALLAQAGFEVAPSDIRAVEGLFAAACFEDCHQGCRLSGHARALRPDLHVLLDEDPRWRQGLKTRTVTSPQPPMRGMQVSTGLHIVKPRLDRRHLCSVHLHGVSVVGPPEECPNCAQAAAKAQRALASATTSSGPSC
mmetsp:Transcript_69046/g.175498  ORF Transcript_69046/g.175498 Transcript_69046/m.175498 type:complete len:193 (+) Transcript_69046:64-642(+)